MDEVTERENVMVITIDRGVGDEITFVKLQGGGVSITIDEPWAGSTETGLGATTSANLSAEQVAHLVHWFSKS